MIVIQTLFQFVAQCVAVILLRRRNPQADTFRMPLYPLPVIVAIVGWLYITVTSQTHHIVVAAGLLTLGIGVYLLQARGRREWPFNRP
jgi:hypothetical protein